MRLHPGFAITVHNDKVIYYGIGWSTDAVSRDLDAVYDRSEADGLFMEAVFDLLEQTAEVRACLAEGSFRRIDDPRLDAQPLLWSVAKGYNLYYLKLWRPDGQLVPFRLIYAVDHTPQRRCVWVLGLMDRAENYAENSDFAKRICHDYDRFGIPRIPCQ